jgi:hypothetical protein
MYAERENETYAESMNCVCTERWSEMHAEIESETGSDGCRKRERCSEMYESRTGARASFARKTPG